MRIQFSLILPRELNLMVSFLSTFFLLLRWVLVFQNPLGDVLAIDSQVISHQEDQSHQEQLYLEENAQLHNLFGFCENSGEEKEESEEEGPIENFQGLYIHFQIVKLSGRSNDFTEERPGKGSLHLYDFYHSWKIALS